MANKSGENTDSQETNTDSLKFDLELELNIVLRPFGTKPIAKYVTFDKLSADGCSKGPQHTNGPGCTERRQVVFCKRD